MLYVDAKASAYEHQFMFISTSGRGKHCRLVAAIFT